MDWFWRNSIWLRVLASPNYWFNMSTLENNLIRIQQGTLQRSPLGEHDERSQREVRGKHTAHF